MTFNDYLDAAPALIVGLTILATAVYHSMKGRK